jgi:hypothetical protein
MFVGLGWEKEIRSLGDPHIPSNPSPKFEFAAGNRSSGDYELIPFSQSTQAWRWRVQEEHKQYGKNEKRHAYVPKKDADLDEDKSNETKQEVKVEGKSSKSLSFRRPLKNRMRDKIVSYIDLLRPGPPTSKSSKKYAKRK